MEYLLMFIGSLVLYDIWDRRCERRREAKRRYWRNYWYRIDGR